MAFMRRGPFVLVAGRGLLAMLARLFAVEPLFAESGKWRFMKAKEALRAPPSSLVDLSSTRSVNRRQFLLKSICRHRTGQTASIGEENGRRTGHVHRLAELQVLLDGGRIAASGRGGR